MYDINDNNHFNKLINHLLKEDVKISNWVKPQGGVNQIQLIYNNLIKIYKNYNAFISIGIPNELDIIIVGDLHGNKYDLLHIFEVNEKTSFSPIIDYTNLKKNYFILGDFINRGGYSFELTLIILLLGYRNKKQFHVVRGDHEDTFLRRKNPFETNLHCDLSKEILHRFTIETNTELNNYYQSLSQMFKMLKEIKDEKNPNKTKYDATILKTFKNYKSSNPYDYNYLETDDIIKRFTTITYEKEMNKNIFFNYLKNKDYINIINHLKDLLKYLPFGIILSFPLQEGKIGRVFLTHSCIPIVKKGNSLEYGIFAVNNMLNKPDQNNPARYSFIRTYYENSVNFFDQKQQSVIPKDPYNPYGVLYHMLRSKLSRQPGINYINNELYIGPNIYLKFLQLNKINLCIRGHQPVKTIYKLDLSAKRQLLSYRVHRNFFNRVITIHSNFMYRHMSTSKTYGSYIKMIKESGYDCNIFIYTLFKSEFIKEKVVRVLSFDPFAHHFAISDEKHLDFTYSNNISTTLFEFLIKVFRQLPDKTYAMYVAKNQYDFKNNRFDLNKFQYTIQKFPQKTEDMIRSSSKYVRFLQKK